MWTNTLLEVLLAGCCFAAVLTTVRAAPGDEVWSYTDVRPGAHMFWWLMYSRATGPVENRPLVIWLTGGPGGSSTGWGNFEEAGPQDWNLQPRAITWIDHSHVLFPDSPVGSGYSYVDSPDLYCTNNTQIALDLLTMLKDVLTNWAPELAASPLYIFGESYGGKMGPEFAWELHKAIQAGELNANLQGVIVRDGWPSPDDGVDAYADYSLQTGLVDDVGHAAIASVAQQTLQATQSGLWEEATVLFDEIMQVIYNVTHGVDVYYILDTFAVAPVATCSSRGLSRPCSRHEWDEPILDEDTLRVIMTSPIRDKLITTVPNLAEWDAQGDNVFEALTGDFMKPSMDILEQLLNETTLKVAVVNGQLDLIVCTPGTLRWVNKLNWPGASSWHAASRDPVSVANVTEGYVKQDGVFSMWWINRAGHSTFYFNPQSGKYMLEQLTGIPWA